MSYVVCYTNIDTGTKSYTITDDYENVQLPDQCHIDFVFDKDKEILECNETAEEMFAIQSNMFGFTPADYKREFKDHAGRTISKCRRDMSDNVYPKQRNKKGKQ